MSAFNMNSTLGPDYYQILGVSRDATTLEIQEAFFRLLQAPFKEPASPPRTPDEMELVRTLREEGYDTLTDRARREAYDRDLRRSFIWAFLQANGFQVTTTTRRREIIAFLEKSDFVGFMAREGLPVEKGMKLSLDGRYWFELGGGRGNESSKTEPLALVLAPRPVPEMETGHCASEYRFTPVMATGYCTSDSRRTPVMATPPARRSRSQHPQKGPQLSPIMETEPLATETEAPPSPGPSIFRISSFEWSSIPSRMPSVWNMLHQILIYALLAILLFRLPDDEVRDQSRRRNAAAHQMNHYEVLGVPHTASLEDMRRAYHAAALQFHPDKVQHKTGVTTANGSQDDDTNNAKAGSNDDDDDGSMDEVSEFMYRINEAYTTLSTDARCLYDLETLHIDSRQYAECMEMYALAEAHRRMEQRVEEQKTREREEEQESREHMMASSREEEEGERETTDSVTTELSLVHPLIPPRPVGKSHRDRDNVTSSTPYSVSKSLRAAEMALSEYVMPAAHAAARRLRVAGDKLYLMCYKHESTRLVVFFLGQLIGMDICGVV